MNKYEIMNGGKRAEKPKRKRSSSPDRVKAKSTDPKMQLEQLWQLYVSRIQSYNFCREMMQPKTICKMALDEARIALEFWAQNHEM